MPPLRSFFGVIPFVLILGNANEGKTKSQNHHKEEKQQGKGKSWLERKRKDGIGGEKVQFPKSRVMGN